MQNIIFTSVPLEQLQTAISEAVKNEFLKLGTNTPPEEIEYITRKETAQILGVSLVTLNSWAKSGTLQGYRIGSRVRYKKNEVLTSVQKMQTLTFGRRA
jgi:excisionase family DNA binding protein